MKRLLAYEGPVVHVDHSHRAPAPTVSTGRCLSKQNNAPIRAACMIEVGDQRTWFEYTLDELHCEWDYPIVSTLQVEQLLQRIDYAVASIGETRWVFVLGGGGRQMPLRTIQPLKYEHKSSTTFRHTNYDEDRNPISYEALVARVQSYLSQQYNDPEGPVFRVTPVMDARER